MNHSRAVCYDVRMIDDLLATPRTFSTVETARLSSNTVSRIDHWTRLGIRFPKECRPDVARAAHEYSLFSVLEAARCGLLANRGMSTKQLKETAVTIRQRVAREVKPKTGYDLHARAAYGFFIETVKGMASLYPVLTGDPTIKRFVQRAQKRVDDKDFWRLDHLHDGASIGALVSRSLSSSQSIRRHHRRVTRMHWVKIREAVEHTKLSRNTLYSATKRGQCRAIRIGAGRNYLWCVEWLDEYLAMLEQTRPHEIARLRASGRRD